MNADSRSGILDPSPSVMTRTFRILKRTVYEFFEDGCPSQAAALSYYTVFSLPPLMVILISVASSVLDTVEVQGRVQAQIRSLVGPGAADQVQTIVSSAKDSNLGRGVAAVFGFGALFLAATTAFAQLQAALNQAWNVKPDPRRSEVRSFFVKRLVSFGMILTLAFLTLVSLLLSAALAAFSDVINQMLPSGMSATVLQVFNNLVSLTVFTGLFATMFKVLPDAKIKLSDAIVGGVATAVLFSGGKFAIGLYLGNSDVTSVYGAAGSLAVILVWTYYSSMTLLLGAEFTQVWSERHGRPSPPEEGAVKVRKQEIAIPTA